MVFLVTFSYIWISAFYSDGDYYDNMPRDDPQEYYRIAKKNCWQAIYSILAFNSAFAYL